MNYTYIIASLLISFSTFASSEICSDRIEYFSQQKSSIEQSLNKNPITNEKIVLVGVEHLNYEINTYPLLIDAINSSNYNLDCFLLETEFSKEEKFEVDKLNKGATVDWNVLKSLRSKGFIDLLRLINSKGLKVYAVDKDIEEDDDLVWLNERDIVMSAKIASLASSKECKKSIFPVGAMHILSGYPGRTNLSENLASQGLSTYKIGLSISGIREADHQGKHRVGSISAFTNRSITLDNNISTEDFICKDIPKIIHAPYTLNSMGHQNLVLYDSRTESYIGKMNDVNFWLHYSCQTQDCKKKNTRLSKKLSKIGINFY